MEKESVTPLEKTPSGAVTFAQPKMIVRLTETALMLALGAVLSIVPLPELPYGGSITVASMVPLLLIAYRYGTLWGLFSSFAFSLLQLLFGLKNLSYATSFVAAVAIIFLDYLLAFSVLCAGGWFRKKIASQSAALGLSAFCACILRYVCHVISGCTVWAGISIPTKEALIYSLSYNATYMIPETLITVLAAIYLGRVLNFRSEQLSPLSDRSKSAREGFGLRVLAGLVLVAESMIVIAMIFAPLQNAESGELFVSGLQSVPWSTLWIVTAVGQIAAMTLLYLSYKPQVPRVHKKSTRQLTEIGVIAALYTALTLVIAPFSFGEIQCRVSEALTILPVFTPVAIPGLVLGCFLSNLIGLSMGANVAGAWDLLLGTGATLLAALFSYWFRKVTLRGWPWLSLIPPVFFNALIVGGELAFALVPKAPWDTFPLFAAQVGLGEAIAVFVGGSLLYVALTRSGAARHLFASDPPRE